MFVEFPLTKSDSFGWSSLVKLLWGYELKSYWCWDYLMLYNVVKHAAGCYNVVDKMLTTLHWCGLGEGVGGGC